MCGIVVSLGHGAMAGPARDADFYSLCAFNAPRGLLCMISLILSAHPMSGPDSSGSHHIRSVFTSEGTEVHLSLFACVLHLRGERVVDQPHKNDSGDVLCWNGEVK